MLGIGVSRFIRNYTHSCSLNEREWEARDCGPCGSTKPAWRLNVNSHSVNENWNQRGSSLLQTALTLIVVGVLVGASVAIIQPMVQQKPKEATHKQLDPIKTALSEFAARHGRLPCPARLDSAPDTSDFGREYCDAAPDSGSGVELSAVNTRDGRLVRSGGLPVRTLDMPDEYFMDGYQNPYLYSVTELVTTGAGDLNHDGGIYVKDANGIDVNVNPGWILYTLVSTGGRGNVFDCDLTKADGENCNRDGIFLLGEYSQSHTSSSFYDDHIAFSEREPSDPYSLCGSKGKVYAPAQAHKDRDDCVSVMAYKEFDTARIATTQDVTCTALDDFCEDAWIPVMSVASGDYIFHWDSYLRFDYAQPGQYAVVEFKVGENEVASRHIPFNGTECQDEGALQHVKGVSRIATETGGEIHARIKLYGGSYNSARCGGEVSKLTMVSEGLGLPENRKAMTVKAFSRFGEGKSVGSSSVTASGGGSLGPFEDPAAVAVVTDIEGTAEITRENGIVETMTMDMIIKSQDFVETKSDGVLTMVFVDGTEITLSENSMLDISQYEFDEATSTGEAEYSLLAGVLLYIGGVLDGNGDVTVNTAAGSVGIRGTSFLMRVDVVDRTPGLSQRATTGPNGMMEVVTIECCIDIAIKQYVDETQRNTVTTRLTTLEPGETRTSEEMDAINYFAANMEDYAVMQPRKPWEKVVTLVNRRPEGMGNENAAAHRTSLKTMRDDIVAWYNKGELRKEIHPMTPDYEPEDNVEAAVNILSVVRGVSDNTRQKFHDRIVAAISEANADSGVADAAGEEPIPLDPAEVIDGEGDSSEEEAVRDGSDPCHVDPYSEECAATYTELSCGPATTATPVTTPASSEMCTGGKVDAGSIKLANSENKYQWICQKEAVGATQTVHCDAPIAGNWLGILYANVFSRQPDKNAMYHYNAFTSGNTIDEIYETLNNSCEAKGTCSASNDNCRRVEDPSITEVCAQAVCQNSYYGKGKEWMIEQGARNAGCPVTEIEDDAMEEAFLPDVSSCEATFDMWEPYICDGPSGDIIVDDCKKIGDAACLFGICAQSISECTDGEYYVCTGKKGKLSGILYEAECKAK